MPKSKPSLAPLPVTLIQQRILILRGQRVMIDADLAALFGTTTKRLNEQIKRNQDRFPPDFMFRLSRKEKTEVVANCDHLHHLKFSPQLPHAFTEHGAIMAANVLNSPQAVSASLFVVRAFVALRQFLSTHHELSARLTELEHKLQDHDSQILAIIDAIRELTLDPEDPPKPPVGILTELATPKPTALATRRKKV